MHAWRAKCVFLETYPHSLRRFPRFLSHLRVSSANSDAVVDQFKHAIETNETNVTEVLRMEKMEKELRVAEMHANKVENLMKHEKEIMARPAKSWFQVRRLAIVMFTRFARHVFSNSCILLLYHNYADRERASGGQTVRSRRRIG